MESLSVILLLKWTPECDDEICWNKVGFLHEKKHIAHSRKIAGASLFIVIVGLLSGIQRLIPSINYCILKCIYLFLLKSIICIFLLYIQFC